jgi:hypothetical protein
MQQQMQNSQPKSMSIHDPKQQVRFAQERERPQEQQRRLSQPVRKWQISPSDWL